MKCATVYVRTSVGLALIGRETQVKEALYACVLNHTHVHDL